MDYNKISALSTSFIAFSSFLGVLFAMIYYIFQIKNLGIFQAFISTIIYIDMNLLFWYILKKKGVL